MNCHDLTGSNDVVLLLGIIRTPVLVEPGKRQ